MKWHHLDFKVDMDSGSGKANIDGDELVLITECRCGLKRIYRFTSGIADELLRRLGTFRIPGAGGAVERNKTEALAWICPKCGTEVRGQLELRLTDTLIDEAKGTRNKDSFEGSYLGVINIKSEIEGARLPTGPHAYFISPRKALNGLSYWCGSCGNKGWNYEVSKKWMTLIERVEQAFKNNDVALDPVEIEEVFCCQQCHAKIKLKATLTAELPEDRAELLVAYERWREAHPRP